MTLSRKERIARIIEEECSVEERADLPTFRNAAKRILEEEFPSLGRTFDAARRSSLITKGGGLPNPNANQK
jgi:hypothetical protein